jgi:hypothetical protein
MLLRAIIAYGYKLGSQLWNTSVCSFSIQLEGEAEIVQIYHLNSGIGICINISNEMQLYVDFYFKKSTCFGLSSCHHQEYITA